MVPGRLEHTYPLQGRDWQGDHSPSLGGHPGLARSARTPLSFLSLPFPKFLWAPTLPPPAWFSM